MPGWYIHLDVARNAMKLLEKNAGAAAIFGSGGPNATELTEIATNNPAYVALGAIGPDIFFLLPDLTPPYTGLWGAANTIKDLYTWWDENFLGPYEETLGPILMKAADEVDAVTGGLASTLSEISFEAFRFFKDSVIVMIARSYDVFGLFGSGVSKGYDEQVFYWSDMLHYRKTYEFAAHLWKKAEVAKNDRFKAFALGWMSHLATDVTGHCFVNEKCGGPWRLHWQRHHLVENHMDAKVYDSEDRTRGRHDIYQMLSSAALHLWIAFKSDGTSYANFYDPLPGKPYPIGDDTDSILARRDIWDVDSVLPDDLGQFIADALKEVYNPVVMRTSDSKGACSDHPKIFDDALPGSGGYPDKGAIIGTYWWLFKYVKFTTTDYFKLLRPPEPEISFANLPFPSRPAFGDFDPSPGPDDDGWVDFLETLLSILAWIVYLAEVGTWPEAELISLFASAFTYPVRKLLYDNVELPLYNAWAALHWYLAMTGFTYPMQQEINIGITTLGVGVGDVWKNVQAALEDPSGLLDPKGALKPVPLGSEPSGSNSRPYPQDVVTDPPTLLTTIVHFLMKTPCASRTEEPSEFLRPWRWPESDNEGDLVQNELPAFRSVASPYRSKQDATVLMNSTPGDYNARNAFENAKSEFETIQLTLQHLPEETLGDPVDYTGYLVAKLTRDDLKPEEIANFNLDADREYGALCWDWARSSDFKATPDPYGDRSTEQERRVYHAPLRPGHGWCDQDLNVGEEPLPPLGSPDRPTMHDPLKPEPVRTRYIDREEKFQ
jgi:hypothetical protein